MAIWDVFKSNAPAAPAPVANQAPAAQPGMPSGAGIDAVGGQVPTQQPQEQQSNNPLDAFSSIWAPKEGAPVESANNANLVPKEYVNLPADALAKAAQGVDFTKQVPQELMQKVMAGDPAAIMAAMNLVAQNALQYSVQIGSTVTNQAMNKGNQEFESTLQNRFRDMSSRDAVYGGDNKFLSHPTVQPVAELIRNQILQRNPAATAKEVEQAVVGQLKAMGSVFNPSEASPQVTEAQQQIKRGEDFSQFMN
jgi:hypothetical protein